MKKENEEKTPIPWEAVDPKPPVIQSGHMENRRSENKKGSPCQGSWQKSIDF